MSMSLIHLFPIEETKDLVEEIVKPPDYREYHKE